MSEERSPVVRRLARLPLIGLAMLGLLAALWGGVQRIGWALPVLDPALPMAHGPLMVCGFLGTLISLERAVALRAWWSYGAPLLAGTGGVLLMTGAGGMLGPLLITAASAVLVAVFGVLLRRQRERFMEVMTAGALAWLVGNLVWLFGAGVPQIVHWWIGFLVLTIAGERLELSRMMMHAPRIQQLFLGAVALLGAGLAATSIWPDGGVRLTGGALLLLALWLARYDVVRHTIRAEGLTRYVAICLLLGYVWLFVGGALMLLSGAQVAGPIYDAYLHAVFVGFVFSMIFGHAPIIFPSVLELPLFYRPLLYLPLALLHATLVLRTIGDVTGSVGLRRWGGIGSAAAILLFLMSVGYSIARRDAAAARPRSDILNP